MNTAQLIAFLLNAAATEEANHQEFAKAQRYGNAAYYQGRRDALLQLAEELGKYNANTTPKEVN